MPIAKYTGAIYLHRLASMFMTKYMCVYVCSCSLSLSLSLCLPLYLSLSLSLSLSPSLPFLVCVSEDC